MEGQWPRRGTTQEVGVGEVATWKRISQILHSSFNCSPHGQKLTVCQTFLFLPVSLQGKKKSLQDFWGKVY